MADEAPAEKAPTAEGAGTNNYRYDVYTTPHGYQNCECLAKKPQGDDRCTQSIPGTMRYLTGVPGAFGGYNGIAHGPHPKEGLPPSRETVLKRLGISLKDTMCSRWEVKQEPFQIYSDWCPEKERCMPFPAGAAWSEFKKELPSLESWGPDGPPDLYKSFYPSTSNRGTYFYRKGLLHGTY